MAVAKRKHRAEEWVAYVDREEATALLDRTYRRLQLLAGASSALGGVFMVLFFLVWTGRLSTPNTVRLVALLVAGGACFVNAWMYRRSMRRQADHFAGRGLPDQVLRATHGGLDVWSRAGVAPVHLAWEGLTVHLVERQGATFVRFSPDPPFTAATLAATGLPESLVDEAVATNAVQISAAVLDVTVAEMVDALRHYGGDGVRFEGKVPGRAA